MSSKDESPLRSTDRRKVASGAAMVVASGVANDVTLWGNPNPSPNTPISRATHPFHVYERCCCCCCSPARLPQMCCAHATAVVKTCRPEATSMRPELQCTLYVKRLVSLLCPLPPKSVVLVADRVGWSCHSTRMLRSFVLHCSRLGSIWRHVDSVPPTNPSAHHRLLSRSCGGSVAPGAWHTEAANGHGWEQW